MSSLFTADLHLNVAGSDAYYRNFFSFLKSAGKNFDSIYILGDLFTYWYEHPRYDMGRGNPALGAMKKLSQKGKKIYFLYGNRDFAAGEFFKKHSRVRYIGETLTIDSRRGKALLCHGDRLAKKDFRYQVWRKVIRSSWASFIFRHLPVSGAIAFADAVKKTGQGKISYKKVADMIEEGVIAEFKKGYDVIIAGHAHYKNKKTYTVEGRRKTLYLLPEYSYPGEFLVLDNNGRFSFEKIG